MMFVDAVGVELRGLTNEQLAHTKLTLREGDFVTEFSRNLARRYPNKVEAGAKFSSNRAGWGTMDFLATYEGKEIFSKRIIVERDKSLCHAVPQSLVLKCSKTGEDFKCVETK